MLGAAKTAFMNEIISTGALELLAGTPTTVDNYYGGSGTVNAPSGRSVGDLLLFVLSVGPSYPGDTGIPGYTFVVKQAQHYGAPTIAVFKRTATGDSSDNPTISPGNYWTAVIHAVSGYDTSNPVNVTGTDNGGYSGNPLPTITTTVDDCLLVVITSVARSNKTFTGPPTGYTQASLVEATNTNCAVLYQAAGVAGSYGGESYSWSGTKPVSGILAIAPA